MHQISELKQLVDAEINKLVLNTTPRDLYEPITYMLSLDAKRMRPVLVLCGCELFDGDLNKALQPALGIEVFHNFTLLHDDIMDKAPLRRTKQTVHEKWNVNIAILSGDTMFVKACQLMMQVDTMIVKPVMELFHQTAIEVCEGQQMDMDFEKLQDVSLADYLTMITNKTAVLLGASLKTGALIAGASATDADHIYEFGKNIGVAFQLKDDILDVFGDDKKFGKLKGGDIVANKKTFLLLKCLELASGSEAAALHQWLSAENSDPAEKVNAVTAIYRKLNVKELAESEMDNFFMESLNHLNAISVAEDRKSILKEFAEKLMVREV
ncbi:MAG: polyprenyl synthetase family protein [Bacteroidota bacterium]|nr:polyprenyl synthetase family protein [Bacteroidota bacterium]